jgi:hypothetical protein
VSRTRIGAALALLALALLALPGGSSGDSSNPTWEGDWNTDFGSMTLDAGGSGSYAGPPPGTLSGNVDGNVDEGTWNQPGDPPKKGTFHFTMSGDGLSFTGDWAYDSGGCGSACGWSGTCVDGPCLHNNDAPPGNECTGAGANAFAAADCDALAFGSEFSFKAPGEKSPVDVSPKKTPGTAEEVLAAFELFVENKAEEEGERQKDEIFASIELAVKKDPGLRDAFDMCLLLGLDQGETGIDQVNLRGEISLVKACHRLLIKTTSRRPAAPRTAANGCDAVFVPAFSKGEKVTKRKRRRAVAAARRQLDVSCTSRPGRLSASIRARHGKKLREVTQPRLHTFVGRRLTQGSVEGQRLGVRWRARPR